MNLLPIRKPSTELRDLKRAVDELIDEVRKVQISDSSTVQLTPTSSGVCIDVKRTFGGGTSTAQVWI